MKEALQGNPPPVEKRMLEIVQRVRDGALAPLPHNERICTHCEADGGCRKPRFAIEPEDETD
jgi:hypothetical protein